MRQKFQIGLALGVPLLCVFALRTSAATITNVTPVNVTPSSFSILWTTVSSVPSISVFADPAGATNLMGQLAVETFPLHTGNPDAAQGYERRQSRMLMRQKTQSLGLMLVRVSGCHPGTTYYYRLSSTPEGANPITYPASGPLPGVTTEQENSFILDDQQLIITVPGLDNLGRIVTLSNAFTAHALASVVGDGVPTNQVFFNANDLFALAGGGNFAPSGAQQFTATVLGVGKEPDTIAQFSLTFSTNFTAANPTQLSFGTEFVAVNIGSTVAQLGHATNVSLSFNSSVGLASLSLQVAIPAGVLTNLMLQALAPEIDPLASTVTPDGTNWLLQLIARQGQVILGTKPIAQFAFTPVVGQPSAFVPLKLMRITAAKPGGSLVSTLYGQSGRAVIIGAEGLLEAALGSNGTRALTLYGKPSSSYAIEYATDLSNNTPWARLPYRIPLTTLSTSVSMQTAPARVFYRAVEFFAEPPVLDVGLFADGTRQLTLYGKPGSTYSLQYATAFGSPTIWTTWTTVALSGSFSFLQLTNTDSIFYRAVESGPSSTLRALLNSDGTRTLGIYGQAGQRYAIEYTTNISNASAWYPLSNITLSSPTGSVNLGNTNGIIFYRLRQN